MTGRIPMIAVFAVVLVAGLLVPAEADDAALAVERSAELSAAIDQLGSRLADGTRLTGWVVGKRTATVTVSSNGDEVATQQADRHRYDVAAALGGPSRVGFDIDLAGLGFGTHELCVLAEVGQRSLDLGCRLWTVVPPRADGPRSKLVISGTGDVHTQKAWFTDDQGVTDYSPLLDGMGGAFLEDDLTVANVECTPSRLGLPFPKRYNLRCPVRSMRELARDGVDVVSQANNHAIDFGVAAMLDGAANLRQAGLLPVGSGRSRAEALTPQLVEVDGWRIAVFGLAQFVEFESWFATADGPGVANGHDLGPALRAIREWDSLVDVVVVTIHWGVERTYRLSWRQTNSAARLVRAGADVIFGHHPHWVQALREVEGAPVFYSLGNFVWFRLWGPAAESGVARVVFRRSGKVRACLWDAQIDRPGSVVLEDTRRCLTTQQ